MDQLSLFDFVFEDTGNDCLGKIATQNTSENYLQRGEKILSLLRKKKRREFVPSGLFESINLRIYHSKGIYAKYEYLISRSSKMLLDMWKKAYETGDYTSFFYQIGFMKESVEVMLLQDHEEPYGLLRTMIKNKSFKGGVRIKIGDKVMYAPIGDVRLTKRQSGGTWYFRGSKNSFKVCDVARYFSSAYLFHCLRERVHIEIKELTEEQLSDNRVFNFLMESIAKLFKDNQDDCGLVMFNNDLLELPYLRNFIKKYEIPVREKKESKGIHFEWQLYPLWFLSDEPIDNETSLYSYSHIIIKLFELLYEVYDDDKKSNKFLKGVATEYAKVYQTKKAIPDKVLRAMETSGFNDYFGYIEIDQDCDLNSILEIEKEFRALQNEIFHQQSRLEDVSLRFRKLGRHKASGLYFPTFKCICVDVRSPSSMAHEYGHMLDYENGCVSKGVKFQKIRMLYTELFEKFFNNLPSGNSLRSKLEGNGKFNKAYFLEPTEIFARCLEMYLVRCRKIDNSLVKPDLGFAYPEDENLMRAIEWYFDEFFGITTAAKAASGGY